MWLIDMYKARPSGKPAKLPSPRSPNLFRTLDVPQDKQRNLNSDAIF
jgi:hypothetical protein